MTQCSVAGPALPTSATITTVGRYGYGYPAAYLRLSTAVDSTVCRCPPPCRCDPAACMHDACVACIQAIHANGRLHVRFHPGTLALDSDPVGSLISHYCGPAASRYESQWGWLIGELDWDHPVLPAVSAWNYYTYDAAGSLRCQRPNDDAWLRTRRKERSMPKTHPASTEQYRTLRGSANVPFPPEGANVAYDSLGRIHQVLDQSGNLLVTFEWETQAGRARKVPRARRHSGGPAGGVPARQRVAHDAKP
jgi:hypothetical protein